MRAGSRRAFFILVCWLLLLAPQAAQAASPDPWYSDVATRAWYYPYVRSLWEEGLTDGVVDRRYPWFVRAYFYPDSNASRAEYTMLTAKTFGLAYDSSVPQVFSDVPPGYKLYIEKPAYGYIQAAARAGIAHGDGGRFRPNDAIPRAQGVAILVRALDLGPLAAALPPDEVMQLLRRFRDGLTVEPSLRNEVALAIKLRILLGYPDGTIQPKAILSHAQAVTLLYRAALIRAEADPNPFSPDGDGVQDLTTFRITSLKNQNARSWRLTVTLYNESSVLRTFSGSGPAPEYVVWDGRDWAGRLLRPGTYYYRPVLIDRLGQAITGAMKPITLEVQSLSAYVSPTVAAPGQRFQVTAHTAGRAHTVLARFGSATGSAVALSPDGPIGQSENRWSAVMTVPIDELGGTRLVFVQALFSSNARQVAVPLVIYNPIWLRASVAPSEARAGEPVLWAAESHPGMDRVEVFWPAGEVIPLRAAGSGRWQAAWHVPDGTRPGVYRVPVRGWDGDRRVEVHVTLSVESGIPELEVFLSD